MKKIVAAFAGSLMGLAILFAPSAQGASKPDDCNRVAASDRALCRVVKAQAAYAYATPSGLAFVVNGRLLVKEITHQGLTKAEMRSYLRGEALSYAQHVTGARSVAVDMGSVRKYYGSRAQVIIKGDRVQLDQR